MVKKTWFVRDLPVLEAVVDFFEEQPYSFPRDSFGVIHLYVK
jgi:hypothetical protein